MTSKFLKLYPKDSKIWCDLSKVDIGVGTNNMLKKELCKEKLRRSRENLSRKIALTFCQVSRKKPIKL